MRRFAWALGVTAVGLFAAVSPSTRAQQPPPQEQIVAISGVLTAVWGDPQAGDPQEGVPRLLLHLTDAQGMTTPLRVPEPVLEEAGGLRALNGRQVVVTLVRRPEAPERPAGQEPATNVQAIRLAASAEIADVVEPPLPLTGPQPRAVILCRFSDSVGTTPKQPGYFTGLMGATRPGLNDFWWEGSYHNIDLNGTTVYGWYNLPNPRSYYIYDSNGDGSADLDFGRTVNDCTGVADADVHFPSFRAIDLNFNQNLDCCAWGGSRAITRDGETRVYGVTWMPPWSQNLAVYAHESGHSLGFPHSSGPYSATYDSRWDPLSSPNGACRTPDVTYGCVPVHTIMYHKDLDLWIPALRRFDAVPGSSTTILIEGSAQPGAGGYLFAKIPIAGSTTRYYTVEARRFAGYDVEVPGEAIVIHDVLTTRSDRDAQVVDVDGNGDPNDAGAMWTPGESFLDVANNIAVRVNSQSGSGYSVTISRAVVQAISASPNSGTGRTQAFTLQYSDTAGATADLSSVRVRFSAGNTAAGSCTVRYNPMTAVVELQDDAGVGWLPGTLGTGTLGNSQCTLNLVGSSAAPSGTNLTLVLQVTFIGTFSGTKDIYMMARSAGGMTTGWQLRGTWTVPGQVDVISASPNAGTGLTQAFTLQYLDELGVTADLSSARVRFAAGSTAANSCTVRYDAMTGVVELQDDAGVAWMAGAFGSGSLANNQCTVNLASSTATPSGANLTMVLSITFNGTYAGAKNIYMLARSAGGSTTGWQQRGTWTVPLPTVQAVSVSPNTGSGLSQAFTLQYSDSAGVIADLSSARVRFAASNVAANGCTVRYDATTGIVGLQDDAGVAWIQGTLGSGMLANHQCTVNLAASSTTPSGANLTLVLSIAFSGTFTGAKDIYMLAKSAMGPTTGWQARGTWTVPPPTVQAISVSPNAGTGLTQAFTLLYSDSAGATADLSSARVRFAVGNVAAGSCTVRYDAMTGVVELQDNAGVAWTAGTLGSGVLANSQCTVNLAASTATPNGADLTLVLQMTFSGTFVGAKDIYMMARSAGGTTTGWLSRGTFTVN